MQHRVGRLIAGLLLIGGLVGCGDEVSPPANTPVVEQPTTALALTPSVSNITVAIAAPTITSGPVERWAAPPRQIEATLSFVPTIQTTTTISPTSPAIATSWPIYAGLKPIDIGAYAAPITAGLGQAASTARPVFYYTGDSFDKLAAFYNSEMPRLGYVKLAQQPLPNNVGLPGSTLIYSRGSGLTAEVEVMLVLGPLDSNLVGLLAQAAPEATSLKTGDNLIIRLAGLTGANLTALQQSLASGGTGTPTPVPTPTR